MTLFNPASNTTGYSGLTVELKGRPTSNTENLVIKVKGEYIYCEQFLDAGIAVKQLIWSCERRIIGGD